MKLAPHRIAEARGTMSRPELARRLSRRDPLHLGTTSAQQIKRWEEGHHRMRYESETIVAIAAETPQTDISAEITILSDGEPIFSIF